MAEENAECAEEEGMKAFNSKGIGNARWESAERGRGEVVGEQGSARKR